MSFVTFGEIMLRLTSSVHGSKISDARSFDVHFAGSESNVATSLAILGNKVKFITKVPANQVGDAAIRSLNSFGIDTSSIIRGGSRLGTYFIEIGTSIRPSAVVYDRANSAISEIAPGEFDWQKILEGNSWVFVSGITPALSDQCAEETIALVSSAKKMGVKVCFDFNFRRTLWKDTNRAKTIFTKILNHTDLLCGNAGSVVDVYDYSLSGNSEMDRAEQAMEIIQKEFGTEMLAFTIRHHTSASQNELSAILKVGDNKFATNNYAVDITDRFGTGDAFAAALLHGLARQWDYNKAIEFATAAFALKHTIRGDQHTSSEQEIISITEGKTSGHVLR